MQIRKQFDPIKHFSFFFHCCPLWKEAACHWLHYKLLSAAAAWKDTVRTTEVLKGQNLKARWGVKREGGKIWKGENNGEGGSSDKP